MMRNQDTMGIIVGQKSPKKSLEQVGRIGACLNNPLTV
jgi:hypothetical protein